ncbi:MAG: SMC family ATPase [Ruminococcus sp.]|nr:SMC family ATPase [Ruminococcus sp.]
MKPLKLTMQAFGSYGAKTVIDFTKLNQNLFLVTGDTGAGKSTVFNAIVFALYGKSNSVKSNKKAGAELQSQFVGTDIKPFVELVFSEKRGEKTEVYKVCRELKYTGSRSGKVSFTYEDGSQVTQDDINQKIEEIVGLTRNQFLQVAMIAQGEFMEMLHASSDKRKEILRKLFGTEIYVKITEEMKKRCKEKENNLNQVGIVCRTEAGHIIIPESYKYSDVFSSLKEKIIYSEKPSVTDMRDFIQELKVFQSIIEKETDKAHTVYDNAGKVRDSARDALKNAQNLINLFEQLEKAEMDIAECKKAESEIKEAEILIRKINSAYEINAVYQRYVDAENDVADTEKKLNEQQKLFPELERICSQSAVEEAEARRQKDEALQMFAQISERVSKTLDILKKIGQAEKDISRKESDLKKAEIYLLSLQEKLSLMETEEKECRKKADELADTEKRFMLWKVKSEETERISEDIQSAVKAEKDVVSQKRKAEKAQQDYIKARQAYIEKNTEYTAKQTAFLDAQAGFIAREKLKPDEPCPVCGSLEHPNPCRLSEAHQNITREMINLLAEETAELQKVNQDKSSKAGSAYELLSERESNFSEIFEKLHRHMVKTIPDIPENITLSQAEKIVDDRKNAINEEGKILRKNVDTLRKAEQVLKESEEVKKNLNSDIEKAFNSISEIKAELSGSRAVLNELKQSMDYPTAEEADRAFISAESLKNEKLRIHAETDQKLGKAKQQKDNSHTLIEKYSGEIPDLKNRYKQLYADYMNSISENNLSESEWKDIISDYKKSYADILKEKIDMHIRKKSAAEGIYNTARKTVGNQKVPDILQLEKASSEAEENLSEAQEILEKYREIRKSNFSAYDVITENFHKYNKLMKEYSVIESLYNRLAGKVSGSRMDIETFVQRYYLQRILDRTNIHFRHMSAGEFEFRLTEYEKAGQGKNKGLDLMVYSAITEKEREVTTLSGGESFMAALSLALGMAEQIQLNSASVNLDMMFIDEGFGSLDEHSRNQAVRVLKEMAEYDRLIGIISHVTEMKQEIDNQLVVKRDDYGSHAEWQIS